MGNKTYSEKLKDPRWQKLRLRIFERDNFICQECADEESMLCVHHIAYNGEPWQAKEDMLITLCESCHKNEEDALISHTKNIIQELRQCGFMAKSFYDLNKIFKDTNRGWASYEPAYDIIKMVVDDDDLWKKMESLFWERLKKEVDETVKNNVANGLPF